MSILSREPHDLHSIVRSCSRSILPLWGSFAGLEELSVGVRLPPSHSRAQRQPNELSRYNQT